MILEVGSRVDAEAAARQKEVNDLRDMMRNMKLRAEENQRAPHHLVRLTGGRSSGRRQQVRAAATGQRATTTAEAPGGGHQTLPGDNWTRIAASAGPDPMEVTATPKTTTRRPPAEETPAKAARGQTGRRPVDPLVHSDPWQRAPSQPEAAAGHLRAEALRHDRPASRLKDGWRRRKKRRRQRRPEQHLAPRSQARERGCEIRQPTPTRREAPGARPCQKGLE